MKTANASTTSAAPSTGEFHPNIGRAKPGANTLQFGNTLFHVCCDSDSYIKLSTGNIAKLVENGDLGSVSTKSNWASSLVKKNLANFNGAKMTSSYVPDMVMANGRLYIFWADKLNSGTLYATYQDLSNGSWAPMAYPIVVKGANVSVQSYVSVNVINGQIRVNYFGESSGQYALLSVMLNTDDLSDKSKNWVGSQGSPLVPKLVSIPLDKSYYKISTEWFSQGADGNYLVSAFYSSDKSMVYSMVSLLDPDGTNTDTTANGMTAILGFSARKGIGLSRDPGGRIYAVHGEKDGSKDGVRIRTLDTLACYNKMSANFSQPKWSAAQQLPENHSTEITPCAGFVFGSGFDSTIPLQGSNGQIENRLCTKYETYVFVFYGRKNESSSAYDVKAQGTFYGTSNIVPEYNELAPKEDQKNMFTLSNIFDSFPYPNENIGKMDAGTKVMDYIYGTSSKTDLTAQFSWNYQWGIKSSATTTKGVGAALASEYKTGPSGSVGTAYQTEHRKGTSMDTGLIDSNGKVIVSPQGRADGHTLMDLVEQASIFYDASGARVSGVKGPLFSMVKPKAPRSSYPNSALYDVYCSTPGDINSYLEDEINKTMKQRYLNLSQEDRKKYFTPGYETGYVENVILPNAHVMANGKKYLEFRINTNGGQKADYAEISNLAVSAGYSVSGSSYVGIGFGEEVSIFGFGEAVQGSIMFGFEYNMAVTGGVSNSSSWGVTANFNYPDYIPGFKEYVVQMYVCKPNNMWAREIEFMAPNLHKDNLIDFGGSKPMKIFFLVLDPQVAAQKG